MTFESFLSGITGSAVTDWVRLAGLSPGRLQFVYRPDVATTLEYGGPPRLDPRSHGSWSPLVGRVPLFQVDCLRDGRVVFHDVVRLVAGEALLPVVLNGRQEVGAWRRDLARLVHRLVGQSGDAEAAWQAAGLQVAANDPLA